MVRGGEYCSKSIGAVGSFFGKLGNTGQSGKLGVRVHFRAHESLTIPAGKGHQA